MRIRTPFARLGRTGRRGAARNGRRAAARTAAALGAIIGATILAACSGSSGANSTGTTTPAATAPATTPAATTPATGSAPVFGPSIAPTGTVGPLSADSNVASILATAEATMRGAQSFLFVSTVLSNAQTTVTSLQVDKDSTAMGTITTGSTVTGIRISGMNMWITGPASFWTDQLQLGSAGQLAVAGKWVLTTRANAAFAAFSYSASIGGSAEQLFASSKVGTPTKVGVSEVDGVQAIGVNDNLGSILSIALSDPYRLLRVEPDPAKTGKAPMTVVVSQWGAPVPFEAPPADQVITFESIPKS